MAIARSAATKTAQRAVASGAEDDLLLIVGIGPTYAVRLRELGITTFAALAKSSDEILVEVTGGNVERAIREDWRGQARQLARAKSKGKSAPAG
jgi:predicted flap endonuclease-1-like 5' DNA nuclease